MALGSALSLLELIACTIFHIWATCGLAEALSASHRIVEFCQTAVLHWGQKCFFLPDFSLLSDLSGNSLPEFNTAPTHRQKAAGCLRCYFRGFLNTVRFNRLSMLITVCSFWLKTVGIIKCITFREVCTEPVSGFERQQLVLPSSRFPKSSKGQKGISGREGSMKSTNGPPTFKPVGQ